MRSLAGGGEAKSPSEKRFRQFFSRRRRREYEEGWGNGEEKRELIDWMHSFRASTRAMIPRV